MNDPVIFWILVGGAALVAVILGSAWRAATARLQETVDSLEKLQASSRKLEKKVEAQRQAADTKVEELEELRKKLKKAKKRTASVRQEQSSLSTREQELSDELEGARATISRLHLEIEAMKEAGSKGSKRPAPQKSETAAEAPAPAPRSREPRPVTDEERERLEQKAASAETTAVELRRKVEEAEGELKRARGRAETNHRVYLVTKGELEVVNDKLHTLERHLGTKGFRDLLRASGAKIGSRVTAHVPLDPEAKAGESAEESLAADAEAAVRETGQGKDEATS